MNQSFGDLDSIVQLSKDSNTYGFDLKAGTSWIYPTNYPVREYQFNITQAALHQNTLVSLPTGLGKTFIAAVVMYNFYRWYPMGKIIFMAPTKPLVTQQLEACYNIMAIPKSCSVEMTGTKQNTSRAKLWKEKRVFFITPHILQNDIDSVLELAPLIRCIVIDEAHKALGKNANCEAIKKIQKINPNFRILALSATPGSNFNSVKDVITNLLISHIEVRTNESIDVAPYVFQRKLEKYVIPITGKLMTVKNEYIKVLDRFTRPLLQYNIFTGNCANLTKGRIVLTMKEFKEKGRSHNQYGFILKTLNICVTIYHGYELLIRHGLRAFLQFFKENISKPLINAIGELHTFIDDIDRYLGPLDNIEMLPDGTIPEITGNLVYSHPKFEKLSRVLVSHFNEIKDADTRVMVFCEYRESVMEIYTLLLRHRPLIKPRIFLGQGAISQAQQLQAVKMFKSGQCNTLVSTCIGEEGLDVGEVDLIVCFDISSKSPIRMVQRMGRTGRKRDGRVVILVTEGKEEQLLSECLVQRNNMNILLESQQIKLHLYKFNPTMIPNGVTPECNKMYMTISEPEKPTKKKVERKNTKKNNNNSSNAIKNMFNNLSSSQSSSKSSNDGRNTTTTSIVSKTSSKKSQNKKQVDLRSMFSKINYSQMSVPTTTDVIIIEEEEEEVEPSQSSEDLKDLISNIKSYLDTSFNSGGCEICNNLFDCETIINNNNNEIPIKQHPEWTDINSSIFNKITEESLKKFTESFQPKKSEINLDKSANDDLEKTFKFFNLNSTFDLFSDNSDERDNSFIVNPVIFNRSSGIFDSSRIYQPQNDNQNENENENNFAPSPEDLFNSSDDEMIIDQPVEILNPTTKVDETPIKAFNEDDIIEGSSTEKDKSPILNKSRTRKFGIQRRLFSQTSSNHSNFSKDFQKLESSNDSSMINTIDSNPKFISTPKNKNQPKFSFIPKVTTSQINKSETVKPTKESPKNAATVTNLEHDTNFWDESLFEIDDFDEDFQVPETENQVILDCDTKLPEEQEAPKTQKNNEIEDAFKITQSQNKVVADTNTKQESPKKNNTQQNKNNVSYDSDETIILSFNSDDIFEEIERDNKKLTQQQQEKPETIAKRTPNPNNNKSQLQNSSNKIDNDESLLSITQMIELFNKTQPIENISQNKIINKSPEISEVIVIDDDVLNEFNRSDEEQSLLCFSQNIRRKVVNEKPQLSVLKDQTINKSQFVEPAPAPAPKQTYLRNRNKKMKLQLSTKRNIPTTTTTTTTTPCDKVNVSMSQTQSQDSPLKITKRNLLSKKAIILSDSDDDFEIKPKRKEPVVCKVTPEKKFKRIKSVTDVVSPVLSTKNFDVRRTKSQSCTSASASATTSTTTSKAVKGNKQLAACDFIEYEADISLDEHYISDSEEEDNNMLESSFIHDSQSQSVLDQTDMQAKYMQSVRSPIKYNPFKMPPLSKDINIFSQVENNEDNTYMVDSFCVDSDTTLSERHGLSYLEMVEAQLEKRVRKEKKRKRIQNVNEDSD